MKRVPELSQMVKRATDILFVFNPKGTSVGVFAGIFLDGAVKALSPTLLRNYQYLNLAALTTYHFIVAGVLLLNIPLLFRRRHLPKDIEDAFEVIRRTKTHMSQIQIRMQYLALCSEVISRIRVPRSKPGSKSPA